jgi:hypothetical protein
VPPLTEVTGIVTDADAGATAVGELMSAGVQLVT